MTDLLIDTTVTCPSCWEPHTVTVDLTAEESHFVEDCYVCCNPMRIDVELDAQGELAGLTASPP